MEVILLKRVAKLGQIGDIVKIKDGFGRNFLIPNGMALRATDENKIIFEAKKAQLELDNLTLKREAEAVMQKVDNHQIVVIRTAGESGHLYGSVKSTDIANSLTDDGFKVNKSQIVIANPIKSLGLYNVDLVLHSEITANIIINVARSVEEAKLQLANQKKADENEQKEPNTLPVEEVVE